MIRKTAPLATALLVAASTLAIAQSQTAPTSPPPAKAPGGATTATPPPPAKTPAGETMWYSHQADEMRASKLIGSTVVNTSNETVGDINEIVLSGEGRVAAVVIGVGGFLGMGEREVAVSFDSLRLQRDQNDNVKIVANVTKDTLTRAPQFRWDAPSK
jgi:sporulation protein YlmC with PRC-barrel domain